MNTVNKEGIYSTTYSKDFAWRGEKLTKRISSSGTLAREGITPKIPEDKERTYFKVPNHFLVENDD